MSAFGREVPGVEGVFLDNASTTPLHPAVREAMLPYLSGVHGNPSSIHRFGRAAKAVLESARASVARLIGARPEEIIFTSGGTESDALALAGLWKASGKPGLVTSALEHRAVLQGVQGLRADGCEPAFVRPGPDGVVSASDVLERIDGRTGLVSVMWVNNETGAVQPVAELACALREKGVPFHSDAVQALPVLSVDVRDTPVTALSVSAHKIHGPTGIGALYLQEGVKFSPLIRGGTQERGRRAGTESLYAVAGFAKAADLLVEERAARARHIARLRERFVGRLRSLLTDLSVHEAPGCAPQILNVTFSGVLAETLLMHLDLEGIAASSGSACTSGTLQPSHVLLAMGMSEVQARSSVRFSFSYRNTDEEIEWAADAVARAVVRLRERNIRI